MKKVVHVAGAKSELLSDFWFLGGGGSGMTRGSIRPKFGYGARDENHFTHHDVFHINFFLIWDAEDLRIEYSRGKARLVG